ncbi:hypothetical protein N7540_002095 [Penicillium herquei]|nr:hypothetical protein N7540_002095 [Penicillium herquei]
MWQLKLLSRVIPAFGALAKDFVERNVGDDSLLKDAIDCYSDIVILGCAVSFSRGEWTLGLTDEDLKPLLKALESRFSRGWWHSTLLNTVGYPLLAIYYYRQIPSS